MDLTLRSPRIPSLPTGFFSLFLLLPPHFFRPSPCCFSFFFFLNSYTTPPPPPPPRKRKNEKKNSSRLRLYCRPASHLCSSGTVGAQCTSRLSRADFGVGRSWLFKLEVGSHLLLPHSGSQPQGLRGKRGKKHTRRPEYFPFEPKTDRNVCR